MILATRPLQETTFCCGKSMAFHQVVESKSYYALSFHNVCVQAHTDTRRTNIDRSSLTPPAPVHGTHTRSAFGGGFQRLLTFELFPATPFYMRFSMFSQPGFHNVLAMGNELNKYSFWDLDRLEEGQGARDEGTPAVAGAAKRKRGVAQKVIAGNAFGRESSLGSNASSSSKS